MSAPGAGATIDDRLRAEIDALDATSRMVDAGGLWIHVLSYPGPDVPVVVLPGITSPAITWDFIARELVNDCTLHILDLRGRGLSEHPASGYALSDYAHDTATVVRSMGLSRPVLLGHSLGARIAAATAVADASLVGHLILVDPPMSGPGREPYPTSLAAFLQQLDEACAGTTAEAVRRYYPTWPQRELELRARWLPTCSRDAIAATHAGFEHEDFFALWDRLAPPVTLVHGAESPVVTSAGAREAAARNPAAELVAIPGAGHMVPWDHLDDFVATVRRLVAARPGSPTHDA